MQLAPRTMYVLFCPLALGGKRVIDTGRLKPLPGYSCKTKIKIVPWPRLVTKMLADLISRC